MKSPTSSIGWPVAPSSDRRPVLAVVGARGRPMWVERQITGSGAPHAPSKRGHSVSGYGTTRHHMPSRRPSSRTDGGCLHLRSLVRGMSDGRSRAATRGPASLGGISSCGGSHWERLGDAPVLRHQSSGVLSVATPVRRRRRGGSAARGSLSAKRSALFIVDQLRFDGLRSGAYSEYVLSEWTIPRSPNGAAELGYEPVETDRARPWVRGWARDDSDRWPSCLRAPASGVMGRIAWCASDVHVAPQFLPAALGHSQA
jgi:hypothetical protein